jgi:hypothetical protein
MKPKYVVLNEDGEFLVKYDKINAEFTTNYCRANAMEHSEAEEAVQHGTNLGAVWSITEIKDG